MNRRGLGLLVLSASASVLFLGCATSGAEVYSSTLRYSPAYRGYVTTRRDSSGTESSKAAAILRDPVTAKKVRCREQVVPVADAYGDALTHFVKTDSANVRSVAIMLPFTLAGLAVTSVGVGLVGVAETPYFVSRPTTASRLYEEGVDAYTRKQYRVTTSKITLSLMRDTNLRSTHALYYLGMAYYHEHRYDLAEPALAAFVESSSVNDQRAYEMAEERIAAIRGKPLAACTSMEPVPIRWRWQ